MSGSIGISALLDLMLLLELLVGLAMGQRKLQSDSQYVDMTEATWLNFRGVAH
jgi:hypothetical protein